MLKSLTYSFGLLLLLAVASTGCTQPDSESEMNDSVASSEIRMQQYVDEALANFAERMREDFDAQTARVRRLMEESADEDAARMQDIIDADALYYEEQFAQVAEAIRGEAEGSIEWFGSLEERMARLEGPQAVLRASELQIVDASGQMRIRLGMEEGITVLSFHGDRAFGTSNSSVYSSEFGDDLYLKAAGTHICMMQERSGPCGFDEEEGFLAFTD